MINHFFSLLYGVPTVTASKIFVPLVTPVIYGDTLNYGLRGVRGGTPLTYETFAIQAVKLVDASTYRAEILAKDPRVTYTCAEIGVDVKESITFVNAIIGLPGAVLAEALIDRDVVTTYREVPIAQERAAAVIIGLVRRLEVLNGW